MINKKHTIFLLSLLILTIGLTAVNAANDTTLDVAADTITADTTITNSDNTNNIIQNDNKIIEKEDKNIKTNKEKKIKQDNLLTNASITMDPIGNTTLGHDVYVRGDLYDSLGNILMSMPVKILIIGDNYTDVYTTTTDVGGEYFNNYNYLFKGNYTVKAVYDDFDYDVSVQQNITVTNPDFDKLYYQKNYDYSVLKDSYNIGSICDEFGVSIGSIYMNVTVNNETHTIVNQGSIIINNTVYDSNNPIFTQYGINNISIQIIDGNQEYNINTTITTVQPTEVYFDMYGNNSIFKNYYYLGDLQYIYDEGSLSLRDEYINLTVNGETHSLETNYGRIVIFNNLFDENNPIFTRPGENNITISVSNKNINYTVDAVYVTKLPYIIYYPNYYRLYNYINNSYELGHIRYGTETENDVIYESINLTVNGETHIVNLGYGNIIINDTVFNQNNPIFTTVGDNNITISLISEEYGNYTNNTIFTTYNPLKQLNKTYENVKYVGINYKIDNMGMWATINLIINNETKYSYYDYISSYNSLYKFVPESIGNYTVYLEIVSEYGDSIYKSPVQEFEVKSINTDKVKISINPIYNSTVYLPDYLEIVGDITDEYGSPYIGYYNISYETDYGSYSEDLYTSDGTIYYSRSFDVGEYQFTINITDDSYESEEATATISVLQKVLNNTDNIKLVVEPINDTHNSQSIHIEGKLLDSEDNPISNILITAQLDELGSDSTYTLTDGSFNLYPSSNYASVGVHNISVIVRSENDEYVYNTTVNIIKAQPEIIIYDEGERENIHSLAISGYVYDYYPEYSDKIVYIKVNNVTYNTTFNNDWNIKLPINSTGNYVVEAFIPEGPNNFEARTTATITVNSINNTKLTANLNVDPIDDCIVGNSIEVMGSVFDDDNNPMENMPIKIIITGEEYSGIYTTTTNYDGYYYCTLNNDLVKGNYKVQVSIDDIDYDVSKEQEFTITLPDLDTVYYQMINNNTVLKNSYVIGQMRDSDDITIKNIEMNLTVNNETHLLKIFEDIIINDTVYDINNPIFTQYGNNNITIQIIDDTKVYTKSTTFTTRQSNISFNMHGNNSIFNKQSYTFGDIKYVNDYNEEYLNNEEINLTVNGETHTIITSDYGDIYINNDTFTSDNPIFTQAGDNNITISISNKNVQFEESTIFTTAIPEVMFRLFNNSTLLNESYRIGDLRYGTEISFNYFCYVPINLTVNGETHEILTDDDGDIYITKSEYNPNNSIFTTFGDNNITISLISEEYGNYTNNTILTTYNPLKQLNKTYEDVKYVGINYNITDLGRDATINLVINNETKDSYNGYISSYNNLYKFVPESIGNYTVYLEIIDDWGNSIYKSPVQEFEVKSINTDKIKLTIHLDYNSTVYIPDSVVIGGNIIDEYNNPYAGDYTLTYETIYNSYSYEYYTSDGTIDYNNFWDENDYQVTVKVNNESYVYEEATATISVLQKLLNNTDNIKLVVEHVNDTNYSQSIYIEGKLLDSEDNPISNIPVTALFDESNIYLAYTQADGSFNLYLSSNYASVGVHNISVIVRSENDEYVYNTTVNIIKAQPEIIIYDDGEREDIHSLTISGYVYDYNPEYSEKIIYIKLNNVTYNTTFNNVWDIKLPVNSTGDYVVEAFIPEGLNNYEARTTATVTVNSINTTKYEASISMATIFNTTVGDYISTYIYTYDEEGNDLYTNVKVMLTGESFNENYTLYSSGLVYFEQLLPQGNYHIKAVIDDVDHEEAFVERDFTITIPYFEEVYYEMTNNNSYINKNYYIGRICNQYGSLEVISLNVTVNNETHTILVRNYDISINDTVYDKNNPIFTTPGDNNITIQINGEDYKSFINNTIYTTIGGQITFNMYGNGSIINKNSYSIGDLSYGNENGSRWLDYEDINLTVNGETHTIQTTSGGDFKIDSTVFSKNNPVFTRYGDNNITISVTDYDYTENTIFTTINNNYTITLNKLDSIDMNESIIISGYLYNPLNYTESYATVNVNVDNNTYYAETDSEGYYEYNYTPTDYGQHNVTVSFEYPYYDVNINATGSFYTRTPTKITINANDTEINKAINISFKLINLRNNRTFTNTHLTITIDNQTFTKEINNTGVLIFNYTPTHTGILNITASYKGSNRYAPTNELYQIVVFKESKDDYIKELEDKIKEYENKTQQLNQTIQNQTKTISDLNKTVASQNKTISDMNKTINSQNKTISDLNNTVKTQNNTINSLNDTVKSQNKTISDLNNTVKSQNSTIKGLNDTVKDQNRTIADLNKTVASQDKTISDMNKTINSQNKTITDLNSTVKDQNKTIADLNNTVKAQNSTIKGLNDTVKAQDKTIADLNNTVKAQNSTIKGLNDTVKAQNKTIVDLNKTVASQDKTISDMNNTINNQNKTISDLNNTVKTQNNTINSLNDTVKSQNKTISDLNNTVKAQNSTIKGLNNTVKAQNKTISNLNNTVNNLQKENSNLKDTIKQLNEQVSKLQKQLEELTKNTTKLDTFITINLIKSTVGEVADITANIVDKKGNKVNEGYVIYKINGITLKDSDGNVLFTEVKNGTSTLKYEVPKGWTKNTTQIQAVYFETEHYNEARVNKTGIFNISNGVANIKIADMPVHENGENTQFVITVTDAHNNPINGGTVIVKANGVTLKDANGKALQAKVTNGVAIIDYKIQLGARVHNITAIYANTGYNRAETSNNLTVTKGESFIRYEPITTKTNYTLVTATIIDKNKEALYTNTTVGIKIDGKTVATTKAVNGIINVVVPTNLKAGVHTIVFTAGETGAFKSDRLTSVIIKE